MVPAEKWEKMTGKERLEHCKAQHKKKREHYKSRKANNHQKSNQATSAPNQQSSSTTAAQSSTNNCSTSNQVCDTSPGHLIRDMLSNSLATRQPEPREHKEIITIDGKLYKAQLTYRITKGVRTMKNMAVVDRGANGGFAGEDML